jgi:hypothetical protein
MKISFSVAYLCCLANFFSLGGCGGGDTQTGNATPPVAPAAVTPPAAVSTPAALAVSKVSTLGTVSLAYNATTQVSVFAYEAVPSWDANATIEITNTSDTAVSITTLDGQYQIGGCTSTNARGISRRVVGIGAIDQAYLQPGYPYAIPVQQFSTLPALSKIVLQITLQGCPVNLFSTANPFTSVGIDLAIQSSTSLSRSSATAPTAAISFTSRPAGTASPASTTPPTTVGAVYGTAPAAPGTCYSVPNVAQELSQLNLFWNQGATLCAITGLPYAAAYRERNLVVADQGFLDSLASKFGRFAPTGVLAHEWGHLVQGATPDGVSTELQADCLAGVHLKWAGLSEAEFGQFEKSNFYNGGTTHGTGPQRAAAARRGYTLFDRTRTYTRQELVSTTCPYGTNY